MLREGVRSSIMLPLIAGEEAVGLFFLDNRTAGAYTERDLELLEPVAQQLALAIQNNRLLRELQDQSRELAQSVEEMKVLREVGQTVESTLDFQTVLTTIVAHAVQLSETDGGLIYEYDERAKTSSCELTHGMEEEIVKELRANPIRLGEGAVGRAAVARKPISFSDIEVATYEPRLRVLLAQSGFQAVLNIPLLRGDRIFGGLSVCRKAPGEFSQQVVDLLRTFATQSVLAIQNARQFHEIEEKGRQLALASKHKSQFLANMSHELRTPLNAILGYTELILDNIYGEAPEKIRDALKRVDKNAHHLLGLINDVLDLSKIEAGSLTLSLSDYAMNEIAQTAITTAEPLAREKKLALKMSVPADLPRARGDERRITQVLLNLIGNAIKFTDAGEVRLEVAASDGVFLVSVADTGVGIGEAEQSKIFEEFHQADGFNDGTKGGTGLGLSIAKRIINLHGGRIWVESNSRTGLYFSIHASDSHRATVGGEMSKRILIIEDQEDTRRILRDLLKSAGYEMIEAVTGEQGLVMARIHRPDLILMDIQLPDLDGYETSRRIKADPALQSIPIVAVTSYAMSGDDAKAYEAGCVGYVTKPFSPRQLLAKLREFLPVDDA